MPEIVVHGIEVGKLLDAAMEASGYEPFALMTAPSDVWYDTSSDRTVAIAFDIQVTELKDI